MPTKRYDFTTEDVAYLTHGERRLMARLFKPKGHGPFAAYVDLHGGAWNEGDLADRTGLGEFMARHGYMMATLNFRHGVDGYPTALMDINYAVRWVKAHAGELAIDPNKVVLGGASSGGHLAMLAAMRPRDPRYAAIALAGGARAIDAAVCGVFMQWPVINPLSRYRYAQRLAAGPNPPEWSKGTKEKHDRFWKTEAAMAEGNPMLILERGEAVSLPPAFWLQGRPDDHHDYHDIESSFPGNEPERFVHNYRKAGGEIEIAYFDNAKRNTEVTHQPVADFMASHVQNETAPAALANTAAG
jgi:acetyl esterase/lipase